MIGAALFAIPATTLVHRFGRRPSLAAGYACAASGAVLIVLAAMRGSVPLLFAGTFLLGGCTAAVLAWGAQAAADGALRGTGALGPVDGFGLEALERGCAEAGLARV